MTRRRTSRNIARPAPLGLPLLLILLAAPQAATLRALAQAPAADPYEPNDTLNAASGIPNVASLPSVTIYPTADEDFYRILAIPGPLRLNAYGAPGLDLELTVFDSAGQPTSVINDPASANASYSAEIASVGYIAFKIRSTTPFTGVYQLEIANTTPTATSTPLPTATSPFPTYTPTPDQGGQPDYTEPNYDFVHAYRIAPGTKISGLNFNSGLAGQKDNDFFVMAARAGVRYTCQTADLGPSVDTNLIVYASPNFNDVIDGNDDEDTQSGLVASKLEFTAPADGDIYLLVGYKFPIIVDLRYPGAASYSFECNTSSVPATSHPSAGAGGGIAAYGTPYATPISIALFDQPHPTARPTVQAIQPFIIDLVIAYDRNADKKADADEGVSSVIVHALDTVANQELARGVTDVHGSLRFILAVNHPVRVSIPYLAAAHDFQPDSPAQWIFLVPPANVPGLIP